MAKAQISQVLSGFPAENILQPESRFRPVGAVHHLKFKYSGDTPSGRVNSVKALTGCVP